MNEEIIVKFNKKIYHGFIFSLFLFVSGLLMSVFTIEDDPNHSAIFYEFGGIYLQLFHCRFSSLMENISFKRKKPFILMKIFLFITTL